MDGRKNNKGTEGNKGGTGRPSLVDEKLRAAVIDKCWDILNTALDDDQVNDAEKRKIALEIVKKTIPQQIDGNLNGNFTIKWATEQSQSNTPQDTISENSTTAENAG